MKLAIVGSGISGLSVAHTLQGRADITLFEAGDYFGGHTHTVDITLPTPQGPVTHGVDTGFLVYNERTYPNLINLFAELGVETAHSDMSFSVKVPNAFGKKGLEWSGSSLNTVFAQRSNLVNGRFLKMLRDLVRFNKLATQIAEANQEAQLQQPLGEFLRQHRFSDEFRDWYFLPMIGCIWSCPTDQMLQFPDRHDDPLLPQPRADPGQQPATLVHGEGRRPPLCGQDHCQYRRQAAEHACAPD